MFQFVTALFLYASAFIFIYAGFNVPGSEGLNHHVMPVTEPEWLAAALIVLGCWMKLTGHVVLLTLTRAR